MKKIIFLAVILLVFFSGCLTLPVIKVKELNYSQGKFFIKINSNKEVKADIKLSDGTGVSCSKDFKLKQGDNLVEMQCDLSGSKFKVEVTAEEQVFSKQFETNSNDNLNEPNGYLNTPLPTQTSLIERTIEGRLMKVYEKNLLKSDECTAEKFFEKKDELMEKYPERFNSLNALNQEKTEMVEQEINKTKDCDYSIEKETIDEGNNKFTIKYSLTSGGNCEEVYVKPKTEADFIIIEVDLANNSVKVVKGPLEDGKEIASESQEFQKEYDFIIDYYGILSECFKAWQMGVAQKILAS